MTTNQQKYMKAGVDVCLQALSDVSTDLAIKSNAVNSYTAELQTLYRLEDLIKKRTEILHREGP